MPGWGDLWYCIQSKGHGNWSDSGVEADKAGFSRRGDSSNCNSWDCNFEGVETPKHSWFDFCDSHWVEVDFGVWVRRFGFEEVYGQTRSFISVLGKVVFGSIVIRSFIHSQSPCVTSWFEAIEFIGDWFWEARFEDCWLWLGSWCWDSSAFLHSRGGDVVVQVPSSVVGVQEIWS